MPYLDSAGKQQDTTHAFVGRFAPTSAANNPLPWFVDTSVASPPEVHITESQVAEAIFTHQYAHRGTVTDVAGKIVTLTGANEVKKFGSHAFLVTGVTIPGL